MLNSVGQDVQISTVLTWISFKSCTSCPTLNVESKICKFYSYEMKQVFTIIVNHS